MDFRQRLEKATERGHQNRQRRARERAARALTEHECKRLHSQHRTVASEHIERCLHLLCDQFPGFQYRSIMGADGWGGSVSRDDVGRGDKGSRDSFFSRMEVIVRPYSKYHVLELVAKGIIRNKEVLNRSNYQMLEEADMDSFTEMVDLWVLEYAERYAADG